MMEKCVEIVSVWQTVIVLVHKIATVQDSQQEIRAVWELALQNNVHVLYRHRPFVEIVW